MKEIFALTKKVRGPQGHGEPGIPYLALAEDGNSYELGNPLPVFSTREAAEQKIIEMQNAGHYFPYEITPITVE